MEDEDQYDEFGNYIGEEDNDDQPQDREAYWEQQPPLEEEEEEVVQTQLVPAAPLYRTHEDVQYYQRAEEVYPEADIQVQLEDTQDISVPMIPVPKQKAHFMKGQAAYETIYDSQFLLELQAFPSSQRCVCLGGDLHSGKSALVTQLANKVHSIPSINFPDFRKDEAERRMSIKSTPVSLALEDSQGKHFLLNLMDTPGHLDFSDEVSCGLALSDGVVLVVDVVEGPGLHAHQIIRQAVKHSLDLVLCISKIDRLVLELKLPPADAYLKIKLVLEDINAHLAHEQSCFPLSKHQPPLSPSAAQPNVFFSASRYNILFHLDVFAQKYNTMHQSKQFRAQHFWGDLYYHPETNRFTREGPTRTFVHFILEPLYKVFSGVVGETGQALGTLLSSLGVHLKKKELRQDTQQVLCTVFDKWLNKTEALVDCVSRTVKDTHQGNIQKLKGLQGTLEKDHLVLQVVKQYNRDDRLDFELFGRVLSGRLETNQKVKVLGEHYSLEDEEDMHLGRVHQVSLFQGRYTVPLRQGLPGNWVLLSSLDQGVNRTATIVSPEAEVCPLSHQSFFYNESLCKVAVEPVVPSELPKMLEGIRKLNKTYPMLGSKVEESGEHVLFGPGELYLDNLLHDLREVYAQVEVKVSDPSVSFSETVIETSSIKCTGLSANQANRLSLLASPLPAALPSKVHQASLSADDQPRLTKVLREEFNWDILASRSVWAFGPTAHGPNLLLDDTLPSETDKARLALCKDSIVRGFQWSTREGPLCEEPLRNVEIKILESVLAEQQVQRGGGQVIPLVRRVCHQAFLMACPRIMEPVKLVTVLTLQECLEGVYQLLSRRRAHVISETPNPGSPLFTLKAHVPTIDSFGMETDLRLHTMGQASVVQIHDHWQTLLADPLDKTVTITPLTPSSLPQLAREFMVKTRKRKGLNEDVSLVKYFDDPGIIGALKEDQDYHKYF